MDPVFPDISGGFDKRIVVHVTTGPYKGLHAIQGTLSQLLAEQGEMPEFVPVSSMPPDNRPAPLGLVRMTHRMIVYKECTGPDMKRFDERQV